jgi:MFS family permease
MVLVYFIPECAGIEWDSSDFEISMIAVAIFVGYIAGNVWWGTMGDTYGRRYTFIYSKSIYYHICLIVNYLLTYTYT